MMTEKTDSERCEEIACYFNIISDEFVPLEQPVQSDEERVPPELYQIAGKLCSMRRPKSQVVGDIPPDLATEYADILAVPLHYIFGLVYESLEWPDIWKMETVTVIPKCASIMYTALLKTSGEFHPGKTKEQNQSQC